MLKASKDAQESPPKVGAQFSMKTLRQISVFAATLILFLGSWPQAYLEKAAAEEPNAAPGS